MADGDNQQPQPGVIDPRMIDQIMSALTPQQPTPQAQPVDMSQLPVTSLLGLAVGGGPQTGMSQQDATAAGNRALLNFGVNMLAASGYSPIRRTFGETFAQGVKGAEESLGQSQAVAAAQKEAQQQYTQQQFANRAEALKTGMSMQELALKLAQLRAAGAAASTATAGLSGATPGATPGAPGSGTAIARDPNVPTVGQQANNPGNVMADSGLPMGATGFIPASGGRKVAAYPDLTTGIAANAYTLGNYANSGVNTVRAAVTRWVGDPKADLTSYVSDISKALKVGPDDKIDLNDPKVQAAFILAQQPHETGKAWFTTDDVNNGVARAADWRAGKNLPAAPGTTTTAATTPPAPAPTTKATTGPAPGPLAPGTTVTAAPTAQGVPVPPGGTETGAYPEAGAGIGRVLAGTTGKVGPAQVTVAPPPTPVTSPIPAGKLLTTGKPPGVASAADIILQGTKLAQGPQPPGTVLAAGPAAGTPPPAPTTAPAAQPGWGTVIGSYGPTTTTPPPAPAPVAGTQAAPAPTPPVVAPTTAPTAPPSGEVPATYTYTRQPLPAVLQNRIDHPESDPSIEGYDTNIRTMAQLLASGDTSVARQLQEARANRQAQIAKIQAEAIQAGEKWQQDQATLGQSSWKTAFDAQQAIKLKQLEGEQAQRLEEVKGSTASETKVMDGLNESREAARQGLDQVDIARTLSRAAGDPTVWQQIQQTHPDFVRWLANQGGLSESTVGQLSSAAASDAAMTKLISMARSGTGFQRMTNLDVQILTSQAPGSVDPQQWREAKLSYLQSIMQRQLQYVDTVRSLRADKVPLYEAQRRAESESGPVVPQVPTFTDLPGNSASQQRVAWATKNGIQPGQFILAPNGELTIAGGRPPASAQPTVSRGPQVPTD